MDVIDSYLANLREEIAHLSQKDIERVSDVLLRAYHMGQTVFIMGNGGSASTASHFCNDLNKGTLVPNRDGKRFKAIALTDNIPLLTAWSNDSSYADCFVEQLRSLHCRGSVVLGISGSGNSENVLRALRWANEHGSTTIGFTGFDGGKMKDIVHIPVIVPSNLMARVEDLHMILCHVLTHMIREDILQGRKTVFIDRDGVINRNVDGDYVRTWNDFKFLPGVLDALKTLTDNNCDIHIISNQAGVGRGLMSRETLDQIHENMVHIIESHGGRVAGVHVCTHREEEQCDCRKPKPGLLYQAVGGRHSIFPNGCFVVGDALTDVKVGRAVGAKTFLVLTGRGKDQLRMLNQDTCRPDWIVPSLSEAAARILDYQPHEVDANTEGKAPYEPPDIKTRRLTDRMLRRQLMEVLPQELFETSKPVTVEQSSEEERLRRQVAEHPNYPDLHCNLGIFLKCRGRTQEAIECLSQALQLNPRYTEALFQVGTCQFQLGQFDEAQKTFEEVRNQDWHHAGAAYWLSRIEQKKQDSTQRENVTLDNEA